MNALISVKSSSDLDREDIIEVITPGSLEKTDYGYKVQYEETKLSGMEGTITTVKIHDDKFILQREGTTTTQMEFIKDKTTISLYNTPYGMLDLKVHTEEIHIDISVNGGTVKAKYGMELSGQAPIMTDIIINIKLK